MTFINKQTLNH